MNEENNSKININFKVHYYLVGGPKGLCHNLMSIHDFYDDFIFPDEKRNYETKSKVLQISKHGIDIIMQELKYCSSYLFYNVYLLHIFPKSLQIFNMLLDF